MRMTRQARDLGAERTLGLASAIADDFAWAGWELADYCWLELQLEGDSVIELAFESPSPETVAPPERAGSGLTLEHAGPDAFTWTLLVPLLVFAALVALLLMSR